MKKPIHEFSGLSLPLFTQASFLREQYPNFKISHSKDTIWVRFKVVDALFSQSYKVFIEYKSPWEHSVWIEDPKITPSLDIHIYSRGNLCLYYPSHTSPFAPITLGIHLVRWTYRWIYSYEVWQRNGNVWPTEYVPHNMHLVSSYNPSEFAKFSIYRPARRLYESTGFIKRAA